MTLHKCEGRVHFAYTNRTNSSRYGCGRWETEPNTKPVPDGSPLSSVPTVSWTNIYEINSPAIVWFRSSASCRARMPSSFPRRRAFTGAYTDHRPLRPDEPESSPVVRSTSLASGIASTAADLKHLETSSCVD
ncbi:F-box protein-like [Iris pallida]|uniref:F-box protein-like n=1 Tax=Iris pallida TaxID=29817 RepID=A0AAX6III5_IRIPA|nr:F-box protein-like [Iris pallida]KAJ6853069.1 F-box protein-like [Iris pallida]